jgi:hypothetical protein
MRAAGPGSALVASRPGPARSSLPGATDRFLSATRLLQVFEQQIRQTSALGVRGWSHSAQQRGYVGPAG